MWKGVVSMRGLMHHHETYYTVEFWNNGEGFINSRKFDDLKDATQKYCVIKDLYDKVEVRQIEVNYTVLFGKDGE